MKAITLHQPWASLIAVGAKRIETRSWKPPASLIGQKLAIHAGKRMVQLPASLYPEYNAALRRHLGENWTVTIPAGAVVAVATLSSAQLITRLSELPDGDELLFGEYDYGRWMWRLDDVRPLDPPTPVRGHQGIWNFNPASISSRNQPYDYDLRQLLD